MSRTGDVLCEVTFPARWRPSGRRPAPRRAGALALVLGGAFSALAESPAPCTLKPDELRSERVLRDLRLRVPDGCGPLVEAWASDPVLAWPVRAAALTALDARHHPTPWAAFSRDFAPVEVARSADGAATFNLLAAWLPAEGRERELLEPLLLPGEGSARVTAVLEALAGRPVHDYLRLLWSRGFAFSPDLVRRLAETDDQDTRRFVNWYVGNGPLAGMEGFLVDQVASARPNTHPGQGWRLFEAAATAGLSELIRAAEKKPPWLGDETTPRGLALRSLAAKWPPGRPIPNREMAARLARVAARDAAGADRGQWQPAADLVTFLLERGEAPGAEISKALDGLARQCLRRRGPLAPFSLAEETCRRYGVPFPRLGPDEQASVWAITLTTLDARFLGAVSRALPDAARRRSLDEHLLAQGARAADGSLRVVRGWGADLEGPGEWCAAVAELGLLAAVPDVERVLATAWPGPAVAALIRFGPAGVPALGRFLVTPPARQLKKPLLVEAIRACVAGFPASEREALLFALRADPVTAAAVREAAKP